MEKDEDPQGLGISCLCLLRGFLDGPDCQSNTGEGGLRSGQVVVSQVLCQLFVGLRGGAA